MLRLSDIIYECADCEAAFCEQNGTSTEELKKASEVGFQRLLEKVKSRRRPMQKILNLIDRARDSLSSVANSVKQILNPPRSQIANKRPIDPMLVNLGHKYGFLER
jgi:hypothetical protein